MHEVKQVKGRWAVVRNNIIFPENCGSIVKYFDDAEQAAIECEKLNRRRNQK